MGQNWSTTRAVRACAVAATLLALAASGCVERRLIIRTNPPGAAVFVDDNEIPGLTPVAISPIYYGYRKIRLIKDGYETLTLIQSVPAPWYEVPPLDFFSENLIPGKIRDQRTFDYQLYPQAVVPKDELLGRAENLRRGTQTVTGVAPPGYRVNPPSPGQFVVPAPGTPGGPPVGGQPYYQLPPGAPGTAMPAGPIYTPPPSPPPAAPVGPSNVGSQPYYPLP